MQTQYIAGVEQAWQAQHFRRYDLCHRPASLLIAPRLLHWIDNQHSESIVVRRLILPRLEFEVAAIYEYPEHLRSFFNDSPTRPGVYLSHGESDTTSLYIGKSVNIRSWVLSHLRTPNEVAMLR